MHVEKHAGLIVEELHKRGGGGGGGWERVEGLRGLLGEAF